MEGFRLFSFPSRNDFCSSLYYMNYEFFDSNNIANPNLTGYNAILSSGDTENIKYVCSYNYLCPYSILGVYDGPYLLNNRSYIKHQIFNNDEIIVSGDYIYTVKDGFQGQVEFFPNFTSSDTVIDTITEEMFMGTSLVSIRIPYNRNSGVIIDRKAFSDCTNLSYIYCYNAITYVGKGAFSGCTSLIGSEISCGDYMSCVSGRSYSLISSNHKNILKICFDCDDESFRKCTSLNHIEFYTGDSTLNELPYPIIGGYSIKYKIGRYAFEGCSNLRYINGYTCDNTRYYEHNSSSDGITIPKVLDLSEGDYCFANCESLNGTLVFENIIDNVKIPEGAFSGCTGITYIQSAFELPNATSEYIGDNAFALTSIPDDIKGRVLKNLVIDEESVTSEQIQRIFGS